MPVIVASNNPANKEKQSRKVEYRGTVFIKSLETGKGRNFQG